MAVRKGDRIDASAIGRRAPVQQCQRRVFGCGFVRADTGEKIGAKLRTEIKPFIIEYGHAARRQVDEIVGGEQVQVDGESVGRAKQLSARVDPAALVVRVAAPRS